MSQRRRAARARRRMLATQRPPRGARRPPPARRAARARRRISARWRVARQCGLITIHLLLCVLFYHYNCSALNPSLLLCGCPRNSSTMPCEHCDSFILLDILIHCPRDLAPHVFHVDGLLHAFGLPRKSPLHTLTETDAPSMRARFEVDPNRRLARRPFYQQWLPGACPGIPHTADRYNIRTYIQLYFDLSTHVLLN